MKVIRQKQYGKILIKTEQGKRRFRTYTGKSEWREFITIEAVHRDYPGVYFWLSNDFGNYTVSTSTDGLTPPSSVIKEVKEALFDYYGLRKESGY